MIKKFVKIAFAFWAILACLCAHPAQGQAPASEYEVKAAFIYNFIKFVEWPPKSLPEKDTPYLIGVLGDLDNDPFFNPTALINYLDRTINGKMISDRKLVIRRASRIANLKDCHLIFINKSERSRLKDILAVSSENSILTVSEMDDFCELGGIINFVKQSGKVRFEINPVAAEHSHLKISSKLLNVAKIVSAKPR